MIVKYGNTKTVYLFELKTHVCFPYLQQPNSPPTCADEVDTKIYYKPLKALTP